MTTTTSVSCIADKTFYCYSDEEDTNMSGREAYTLPDEDVLFANELIEGDLSSDLAEERNLLQDGNFDDDDNADLEPNDFDDMDQEEDGHFDTEMHADNHNMTGISHERDYHGERIDQKDHSLEPQVDEVIEEEVEEITATYDAPRNRADQQPNVLRRQSNDTKPAILQRQIQTRQQPQRQPQASKPFSSNTNRPQNRSQVSQQNSSNNNQIKKMKRDSEEHLNDEEEEEDEIDERKGCRSLVCDPTGIIIAETVYRCMICSFISDSVARSQSHYYKKHMKDDERPKSDKNGRSKRDPDPIEVPEDDELQEENTDEDEDLFEDEEPEATPVQATPKFNQTGTTVTYGNKSITTRSDQRSSGLKSTPPSTEKRSSGNFVFSPSPAGYVPGRNAQRALAAQQNPANLVRGGYVTCAVCNITKYYASVQRRYGQFTCMGCAKFFGRFLIKPRRYVCPNLGSCPLDISPRCKACLLQACINTYIIDDKRMAIVNRNRPIKRSLNLKPTPWVNQSAVSSNTVSVSSTSQSTQQSNSLSFASPPTIKLASTSNIISSAGGGANSIIIYTQRTQPIQPKPQMQQQQTSPPKLQPQHSYPTRSPRAIAPATTATTKTATTYATTSAIAASVNLTKRGTGCRNCANCLSEDCGKCQYCLDKPKFGGPNTLKKKCIEKRCLINPAKR